MENTDFQTTPQRRLANLAFGVIFISVLIRTIPVTGQDLNVKNQSATAAHKSKAGIIPKLPGISEAMQPFIESGDMSGAVTVVVTKNKIAHLEAIGLADISKKEPMQTASMFWLASMTKPVTATAILMLQDEGKLKVTDLVTKYIPAFGSLRTPSGQPANLTIAQILTHTSGLGEANPDAALKAKTLADLILLYLSVPMKYEPGKEWRYTQSGINVASHIVEVVSGMSFAKFLQKRIFDPLGMNNTTFYPTTYPLRVTGYTKNKSTGIPEVIPLPSYAGKEDLPTVGNAGLFSTGPDYASFCQMLLGGGVFDGKRYLSKEAMKLLTTVQTGDLPSGFLQTADFGSHGANYGWGIGTCILRKPHEGVAAMLSPGTFGHGGAWGTQAWIDPVRGVAYILMVQAPSARGDASEIRRLFQQTAADALTKETYKP